MSNSKVNGERERERERERESALTSICLNFFCSSASVSLDFTSTSFNCSSNEWILQQKFQVCQTTRWNWQQVKILTHYWTMQLNETLQKGKLEKKTSLMAKSKHHIYILIKRNKNDFWQNLNIGLSYIHGTCN